MPASKHLDRHREIVGVLIDEGFDSALDFLGLRRFAPFTGIVPERRAKSEPVPVRLRHTLERLGPTFVKIGQAASTRGDVVPEPVVEELRKLQDRVAPFPTGEARAMIESELGGAIAEFFETFEEEPFASASLGQVYGATLDGADAPEDDTTPDRHGTRVIIKVQRPGVREVIDTDLGILMTQARFVATHAELPGNYDILEIADEFASALHTELDYMNEARNAERLGMIFAEDETVAFPEVYWDLTTGKVLTLERLDGIPFNRTDLIDQAELDRPELARRGLNCYLEQIFVHGFYHADPHPGNLLALPDGRVAFTDFGRCGTISRIGRDQLADLLLAIIDDDVGLAVDTLVTAAGSPGDMDVTALEREVSRLITKYYNKPLKDVRIGELITEVLDLVRVHHLVLPSELAMLLATLVVLEGLGSLLDPDFNFVETATPFARKITTERLEPSALARSVSHAVRRFARLAVDLPESLARFARRAGQGEFRVAVKPTGFEPLIKRFEEATNRLAFALVVAAFVVGLSIMLASTPLPTGFVWFARLFWAAAIIVGSWFFISILLARMRGRR